jgi:putative glutamine amidotransferase
MFSILYQRIKDLAACLTVGARSSADGIIEAFRLADDTAYVSAIQWHPEFQNPKNATILSADPIMGDILQACRERRE